MSAIFTKVGKQWICRDGGDAFGLVLLTLKLCYLPPEFHQRHFVIMRQLWDSKSKDCQPDIWISIVPFPTLNFSILMHMRRIACAIKILLQIFWQIKEHSVVSTLSTASKCGWHPMCRWEHPIEWIRTGRWALIKDMGFLSIIIIYNLQTLESIFYRIFLYGFLKKIVVITAKIH